MRTRIGLMLGLLGILVGCGGQPYRVFAVQVAAAPAPEGAGTTAAPLVPGADGGAAASPRLRRVELGRRDLAGLVAKQPQWDLNHATAQTLAGLPGIQAGEVAAIIAGRPYKSKRELLRRKIVTAAQYARWKVFLVVHRATTPAGAAPRR